jgi:ketosteroid isomerase-like protein
MKRILVIALLAIAVSSPALGQSRPEVEQELIKLTREVNDAFLKRDISTLNRILADDWIVTNPIGEREPKRETLLEVERATLVQYRSGRVDDIKVRDYGNVAVVTARATVQGRARGKNISGQYALTDTYVKQQEGWKLVASHASRIGKL